MRERRKGGREEGKQEERKEDNQPRRFFRVKKAHFPPENKKFSLCGR